MRARTYVRRERESEYGRGRITNEKGAGKDKDETRLVEGTKEGVWGGMGREEEWSQGGRAVSEEASKKEYIHI
jgi:hypothetical protein